MFVQKPLTCVEICAGAGGQALGLAMAGFVHVALVEYEADYCNTLKQNRPEWNVICADVRNFDGKPYEGVDLLAGGVPCPPFSIAGKQLGKDDERDLFPEALRLIKEIKPRAVMLENVRGFLDNGFSEYRQYILKSIEKLGYDTQIKLLNASDFGVPQLRPRVVIVGIRREATGDLISDECFLNLDEFHVAVVCANLVGYILKIQKRKNSIDHILKGVKQLVDVGIPLDEKTERGL